MAAAFTAAGYALASVEYRKYPNAKFPDFLLDGAKATAFVKNLVKDYGGNGEIIIAGQSAGAWMSLMLCLNKEYLANEGIASEEIKDWIIDSAQTTSHFMWMELLNQVWWQPFLLKLSFAQDKYYTALHGSATHVLNHLIITVLVTLSSVATCKDEQENKTQ